MYSGYLWPNVHVCNTHHTQLIPNMCPYDSLLWQANVIFIPVLYRWWICWTAFGKSFSCDLHMKRMVWIRHKSFWHNNILHSSYGILNVSIQRFSGDIWHDRHWAVFALHQLIKNHTLVYAIHRYRLCMYYVVKKGYVVKNIWTNLKRHHLSPCVVILVWPSVSYFASSI